ncbi:MAG: hypothetical protein ACT4OG_07935 [Alphaproteobacteria bacterium]
MNTQKWLGIAVAVLAGIALVSNPALARDRGDRGDRGPHHERAVTHKGDRAGPSFRGPSRDSRPSARGFHSSRELARTPPRDFRGAPPSFRERGSARSFAGPSRDSSSRASRRDFDRPRHGESTRNFARSRDFGPRSHGSWSRSSRGPGASSSHSVNHGFHGSFTSFSSDQKRHWRHGRWHHGHHHGKFGWWFIVNGFWFFYYTPIYPYPLYVSASYYYDEPYYDDYYWYWCDDPPGYYPYVRECYGPWIPVPPEPY